MPDTTTLEPRYNCPVCIRTPMHKLKITKRDGGIFLTLDYCKCCGGVWFDKDEVKLSQQITSPKIRQKITQQPKKGLIHCQSCNTLIDRNLSQCPDCGWHNRIACPVCEKQLERRQYRQLTLDICHSCQGVWFDQLELLALWNRPLIGNANASRNPSKLTQTIQQHQVNGVTQAVGEAIVQGTLDGLTYGVDILEPGAQLMSKTAGTAAKGSVEILTNTPDIAGDIVESLAKVTGAAMESIPEVATVMLEVTGEVAGSVTEVLAEILSGLFTP